MPVELVYHLTVLSHKVPNLLFLMRERLRLPHEGVIEPLKLLIVIEEGWNLVRL